MQTILLFFKYLGIKFDSNMSWSSHIDYLSGNISKRIGIVKRILILKSISFLKKR